MKKSLCFIIGIIIFLSLALAGTKVEAATGVFTISNWSELKDAIESSDKVNLTINLSAENANWTANSTITIEERKNCYYKSSR